MNILIPMAGRGLRTKDFSNRPKPLIKIKDKTMIEWAVERIGDDVQAHIGTPVRSSEISSGNDRQALLDRLRDMVYALDPAPLKPLAAV